MRFRSKLDHLERLDRFLRISGDPFRVEMDSGHGEKKPLQICREPARTRGQISGTADILLPIYHLLSALAFARTGTERKKNIHFKCRSRQVRLCS